MNSNRRDYSALNGFGFASALKSTHSPTNPVFARYIDTQPAMPRALSAADLMIELFRAAASIVTRKGKGFAAFVSQKATLAAKATVNHVRQRRINRTAIKTMTADELNDVRTKVLKIKKYGGDARYFRDIVLSAYAAKASGYGSAAAQRAAQRNEFANAYFDRCAAEAEKKFLLDVDRLHLSRRPKGKLTRSTVKPEV